MEGSNSNGLTFKDWCAAAGVTHISYTYEYVEAWSNGVDPSEFKAAKDEATRRNDNVQLF